MGLRSFALLAFSSALVLPYAASQTTAPALAASAPTAVPPLIPYAGQVEGRSGQISATFLLFKNQSGGEPLFAETQIVAVDATGRYKVHLGEANPNGLPSDLFSSGEARWLEVQISGENPQPRLLLASVPYALKAADAATLGGLPASAFALSGPGASTNSALGSAITPDAASTVTTTGGTANKVAKFSGSNTIVNSTIFDSGTDVGIGTTTPAATLDVNGTFSVHSNSLFNNYLEIGPSGTATATTAFDSNVFKLYASAYNSSSKAAVTPHFEWQVEPTGNNTSTPNATMNLLATGSTEGAVETGLYINTKGTIHFASGQTFPATSSTGIAVDGTSTSGTGVEGTSSTGSGVEGLATGTDGYGLYGDSTGNGGIGVYANATGAVNGSTYPIGVYSHVAQGTAVKAVMDIDNFGQAAVLGQSGGSSGTYNKIVTNDGVVAGLWGDLAIPQEHILEMAIIGTTDGGYAGYFENNSTVFPTISAFNDSGGSTCLTCSSDTGVAASTSSHFDTLFAGNGNGTCGIGGAGNLSCTGQIKSLITTPASGRTVETYSVQSPENWIEDFGSGKLSRGRAVIAIDSAFAQTVSASTEYHVFLTAKGESKNLYVTNETANSFEVHEADGGTASIGFDYRVVAKRRGLEGQRLTDVTEKFKTEMRTASLRHDITRVSGQTK